MQATLNVIRVLLGLATVGLLGLRLRLLLWLVLGMGLLMGTGRLRLLASICLVVAGSLGGLVGCRAVLLRRLLLVASLTIRLWLIVHGSWVSVPLLLVLDLIAELLILVALVAILFGVIILVLVLVFFVLFLVLLIFLELLATATGDYFLLGHSVGVGSAAACARNSLLLALHLLAHRLLLLIDQIVHRHHRLPGC